jgi:hypothetical protein
VSGRIIYFAFTDALAEPRLVPKGTLAHALRVAERTKAAGWHRGDRGRWWPAGEALANNQRLCDAAEEHNAMVRDLYESLTKPEPAPDGELLHPADFARLHPILDLIPVPVAMWTASYYRARMEDLYEAMRGRSDEVTLAGRRLDPRQAGAVVWLLEDLLAPRSCDIDLEVPRGRDHLASSDEYQRCDRCGPVLHDDASACRRTSCPLREEPA